MIKLFVQKYYLYIIVVIIAAGVVKHFFDRSAYNDLLEEAKKDLEKDKELIKAEQLTAIKERDTKINLLIKDNEEAKTESAYWYAQAKRKSVNPNYDIDFLTAADIIARANYKPGEQHGNPE